MISEAAVVNLFLTVRVFLVGGLLLVFPRISRKGLLFGSYVGEERAGGAAARKLLHSWDLGCGVVMAVSLLVGWGISLAGHPVRGNLTGTAVLLVCSGLLYHWTHGRASKLVPAGGETVAISSAPLEVDEVRGDSFARFALVACVLTALATAAYVTLSYETVPDRIPTLANLFGYGDERADKSLSTLLLIPGMNLVFPSYFALLALFIASAKRSVRAGSGGRSMAAQDSFRLAMSHLLSGMALFLCMFLTVTSVAIVRVVLERTESVGVSMAWSASATVIFIFVSLVRIMRGLGQGGALLETGSVDAPLTGGLADNAHWIWGVLYFDRADPSLMVESRFGIGYTLNLGNPSAFLFQVGFLLLTLGLVALTLSELGVFG